MHMMVRTTHTDWSGHTVGAWSSMCRAPWVRELTVHNITWNVTEVTCPECLARMGHADFGDQNPPGPGED